MRGDSCFDAGQMLLLHQRSCLSLQLYQGVQMSGTGPGSRDAA